MKLHRLDISVVRDYAAGTTRVTVRGDFYTPGGLWTGRTPLSFLISDDGQVAPDPQTMPEVPPEVREHVTYLVGSCASEVYRQAGLRPHAPGTPDQQTPEAMRQSGKEHLLL